MSTVSGPTAAGAAELTLSGGAAERNSHPRLADLPRKFQDTVAAAPAKAVGAILSLVSEELGAVAAAACQPAGDGRLVLSHVYSPAANRAATDTLLSDLMAAARAAVSTRCLRWTRSGGAQGYRTVAVAVIYPDRPPGAIVFCLPADSQPTDDVAAIALYAAAWVCLVSTIVPAAGAAALPSSNDSVVASVFRICAQAAAATNLTAAFVVLANELQSWLGCDSLCITVPRGFSGARVTAISKVTTFDRRSALVGAFEAAARETMLLDRPQVFPGRSGSPAANNLGELCRQAASPKARSWPCHDAEGRVVCVCVALLPVSYSDDDQRFASLSQWADVIGGAVRLLRQGHEGILQRLLRSATGAVRSLRRARYIALAAASVALLMCAPWPYHLPCKCIVEPVTRRVVCAPFDGILDRTLVRPGDRVNKGDQLAVMDGHELTLQLASRQALLDQARQRQTAALAKRDAATAQFASLELAQLEQEVGLLKRRQDNLAIRSPLDGIVVSGDLHRAEGAPLAVGQKLFEVAPLDRMVVEASVPEHEITGVAEGQSVSLSLESHPGAGLRGSVLRLHPQAEIREQKSVFIAEVQLDTEEASLLPGMSGQAQIDIGNRPIGWILFHRPWHYLRSKLLW